MSVLKSRIAEETSSNKSQEPRLLLGIGPFASYAAEQKTEERILQYQPKNISQ